MLGDKKGIERLADWLYEQRRKAGHTQQYVAEKCGLSLSKYNRLELGRDVTRPAFR
jgi:transcriptional regulator with XRE-family HTH domain